MKFVFIQLILFYSKCIFNINVYKFDSILNKVYQSTLNN